MLPKNAVRVARSLVFINRAAGRLLGDARPARCVALVAALIAAGSGCVALNNLAVNGQAAAALTPPTITYQGARLVQSPAQAKLAAYYCPDVVPAPFGFSGGSALSPVL